MLASSEGGKRASWNCWNSEEDSEDDEVRRDRGVAHEGGMGVSSVGACGGFTRSGLPARVWEVLKLIFADSGKDIQEDSLIKQRVRHYMCDCMVSISS